MIFMLTTGQIELITIESKVCRNSGKLLAFKLIKISEPNSIRWWCSEVCCESWGWNFASKL